MRNDGDDGLDRDRGDVDLALARGVVYTTLALGFQRPTAESFGRLTARQATPTLETAARLIDLRGPRSDSVLAAVRPIVRLRGLGLAGLMAQYDRLFGHTARGLVCPFETEYGPDHLFQQPHALADIAGYYLAFGLQPTSGTDLRVDHVGCECEFMAFLCLKEAVALELCSTRSSSEPPVWRETLTETRKAGCRFLREHLARFASACGSALAATDGKSVYKMLGVLLRVFVAAECDRLHVPPGPATLTLRLATPELVPMACGTGEELIQIQGLRSRA